MTTSDALFMQIACDLARRGLGTTAPNPSVGALVVRSGDMPEVLARGWTSPGGRPHAEIVALEKLGHQAKGCTLYVTLEPCSHHGKAPPCADAIIAAGITRVVCTIEDPDPRVSGQGIARLKQAGVEVVTGILAEQGKQIAQGHISRCTQNRPFVQLKLAVGSDGRIPRGDGKPVWITGPEARAHGHLLRAQADAILVGSGTMRADDPSLTCRLPGMKGHSSIRVVLNRDASALEGSQLLASVDDTPVWLITSDQHVSQAQQTYGNNGIEIIGVPSNGENGLLDLKAMLNALAERSITRLLVEGGPQIATQFWQNNLIDELVIYSAAEPAGTDALVPFDPHGIEAVTRSEQFELSEERAIGPDTLHRYVRKHA